VDGFTQLPSEDDGPGPDGCAVAAFAVLHIPQEAFPALRKRPGPDVGKSLSSGLLRQADDQSVAAAAAVFHAIHDFNLQETSFADWGVVGAPCLLGRTTAAAVLDKYRRLGPRGVSPLVSPYLSSHAVSAMISVALRAHGPNLGVGGGSGAVAEGLLAGLTLLFEPRTPGVWLVLTRWDPEPAAAGSVAAPAVCHAVALALTPVTDDCTGLRLRYVASAPGVEATAPNVTDLAQFLDGRRVAGRSGGWRCPIKGGGEVELTVAAGSPAPRLQRTRESL
jgi:hypothetical protein